MGGKPRLDQLAVSEEGVQVRKGSKAAYLESCAQALSAWLGLGGAPPFLSVCLGGVLTWHLERAVAVGQRESN